MWKIQLLYCRGRSAWSHLEYFSAAAWLNPGDQWQNTNWTLVCPESWAMNYCFRLLSVGMVCYSAVDEGYRSHTSSCVDCAGSCLRISWSGHLLRWFKVRGFAKPLNFSVVIPEMLCGLWEFILQGFCWMLFSVQAVFTCHQILFFLELLMMTTTRWNHLWLSS